MRGFILAAGFGTRLLPLTSHINKALVPLAGKPMLFHSISFLKNNGIKNIGVNTHYLSYQIEEIRKINKIDFEIFFEQPKILGTAGAIFNAREFLKKDEIFIVANVDIIASFDLRKIISQFKSSQSLCTLIAFKSNKGKGTIVLHPHTKKYIGTSKEIDISNSNEMITADFIGFTLYRREFINFITSQDFSITDVWSRALKRGILIEVEIIEKGYWKDIGTPSSLASAHFDIIDGISPLKPPVNMLIDRELKISLPYSINEKYKHLFGEYCWIENLSFIPQEKVERCLVFKDGDLTLHKSKSNFILTKWEEIEFNGK